MYSLEGGMIVDPSEVAIEIDAVCTTVSRLCCCRATKAVTRVTSRILQVELQGNTDAYSGYHILPQNLFPAEAFISDATKECIFRAKFEMFDFLNIVGQTRSKTEMGLSPVEWNKERVGFLLSLLLSHVIGYPNTLEIDLDVSDSDGSDLAAPQAAAKAHDDNGLVENPSRIVVW